VQDLTIQKITQAAKTVNLQEGYAITKSPAALTVKESILLLASNASTLLQHLPLLLLYVRAKREAIPKQRYLR
jgi:hypothetical protein